ncbi:2-amino-4-hydroxy-6-hydroxymethyldihydropteridine diphosphokinase [Corynebacterium tapiri]|uniref:2-amino-4-hydroxy-6-hydroxymethyldihydropteridine diphosphokinase n=1 Tax=Corynebacterium tapiri TaxID=1448266 RepID=A0A5C4U3N9_9CORY|nr:2-amino-4-hydroxy-6-hydroxymethyldihydropteridine diphosphokinase [Corynebacterium tapiri]TNL96039.1 2-amino-4-hydroxy-6-hydroxymethyldihydropteridine diphosphokinase [Corynebacterium tapiri]
MRAVLSIGSNMADSHALLRSVVDEFADELVAASDLYRTPAWGLEDQPDFLNAVLIVEVDSTPEELLARGQKLEQRADRVRTVRWGPRTLDVDIVALGDAPAYAHTENTPLLAVPHPHAHERAFVLVPWLHIEPDAQLNGTPIADLVDELDALEVASVATLGRI